MKAFLLSLGLLMAAGTLAGQSRMRDYGIEYGIFRTGPLNAITDVKGVRVGHATLIEGDSVRTGVTAVIPHPGNIFRHKLPAAVCIGNGYGKMAGYTQIRELGNIETPIVLTNTLGVAAGLDALIDYTLSNPENGDVKSVNGVVGETNDGTLNDIRGRHVTKEHVLAALRNAKEGPVAEGNVGAGTGTICFGFKGGIGTSSRVLPARYGGYTVGVLTQTKLRRRARDRGNTCRAISGELSVPRCRAAGYGRIVHNRDRHGRAAGCPKSRTAGQTGHDGTVSNRGDSQ